MIALSSKLFPPWHRLSLVCFQVFFFVCALFLGGAHMHVLSGRVSIGLDRIQNLGHAVQS